MFRFWAITSTLALRVAAAAMKLSHIQLVPQCTAIMLLGAKRLRALDMHQKIIAGARRPCNDFCLFTFRKGVVRFRIVLTHPRLWLFVVGLSDAAQLRTPRAAAAQVRTPEALRAAKTFLDFP